MPKFMIDISEETTQILMEVGARMRVPSELSFEESLELIIDTMAHSVDAQLQQTNMDAGEPLSFDDALDKVLHPNISIALEDVGYISSPSTRDRNTNLLRKMAPVHEYWNAVLADGGKLQAALDILDQISPASWNEPFVKKSIEARYEQLKEVESKKTD